MPLPASLLCLLLACMNACDSVTERARLMLAPGVPKPLTKEPAPFGETAFGVPSFCEPAFCEPLFGDCGSFAYRAHTYKHPGLLGICC